MEKNLKIPGKFNYVVNCVVSELPAIAFTVMILVFLSVGILSPNKNMVMFYIAAAFTPLLAVIPHIILYVKLSTIPPHKRITMKKFRNKLFCSIISFLTVIVLFFAIGALTNIFVPNNDYFVDLTAFVSGSAVLLALWYFFIAMKAFAPPGSK